MVTNVSIHCLNTFCKRFDPTKDANTLVIEYKDYLLIEHTLYICLDCNLVFGPTPEFGLTQFVPTPRTIIGDNNTKYVQVSPELAEKIKADLAAKSKRRPGWNKKQW